MNTELKGNHIFDESEISGVISARLIISGSVNPEMAKLGYETDPGAFSYDEWMSLADQVITPIW